MSAFWRFTKEFTKKLLSTEFSESVGSLSYSTAFALIPTLAVMMASAKFMGDFGLIFDTFRPDLLTHVGFTPELVHRIAKSLDDFSISDFGIFGALGLIYASTNLILSIDLNVHQAWKETDNKMRWKRLLVFWLLLFFFPLAVTLILGAFSYEIISDISLVPAPFVQPLGWTLALLLLNKFAPYKKVFWTSALISSALAGIFMWLAQSLFFWANGRLFDYSPLYGSLAFLPLFLLWIRIIWQIVLGSVVACKLINDGI